MNNSNWLIGNSQQVNFWTDSQCGEDLAYQYQVPDTLFNLLPPKVSNYINNVQWNIAEELNIFFPNLRNLASQVILPITETPDMLVWKHTANGELPLKEAYNFKKKSLVKLPWTKSMAKPKQTQNNNTADYLNPLG